MTAKGEIERRPPDTQSLQQKARRHRTSTSTSERRQPGMYIDPNDRRKIRVGKANIKRDISIFVGFIGLIIALSVSLRDVGRSEKYRSADSELLKQSKSRKADCGLYLAKSSIPGVNGYGVFAGKVIRKGDVVLGSGLAIPTIPELTQHQLLLKHHPLLANIKSVASPHISEINTTGEKFIFRATKNIDPGEELFVEFQEHHTMDIFSSIPRIDDYLLADEIVQEEIKFHIKPRQMGRRVSYDSMLKHAQRVVSKLDTKVSLLLPTTTNTLNEMKSRKNITALLSMKNRTIEWLDRGNGQCLDNVFSESDGVHFATRPLRKDSVILPVPLHVSQSVGSYSNAEGGFCSGLDESADAMHPSVGCFGHGDSTVILCPLSAATFIGHQSAGENDVPNARYVWSKGNNANRKAFDLPIEDMLKDHSLSLGLSFDVVALRDINAGEKIVLEHRTALVANEGAYSNVIQFHIRDELLPPAWKQSRK